MIREDLRPGTAKAQKIASMIRGNLDLSYRHLSVNYPIWDDLEASYRSYRVSDEEDLESLRKHNVKKIIVPIQFATIQTAVTFMMEVFTAIKPVLRCRGADPASVKTARIMEMCLDYDYRGNRGYFMLQQWFMNAFRYGFSVMENSWGTKSVIRKVLSPSAPSLFDIEGNSFAATGSPEYTDDEFITFEGNKWRLVDPRLFYPDPRVSLANFQDGIFCGHRNTIHDLELRELQDQGIFFNTDLVKHSNYSGLGRGGEMGASDHNRDRWRGSAYLDNAIREAQHDKTNINEQIVVKIIPKEFELSNEERPQDWIFNLINGEVITRAERNPFIRFNYSVIESYPDMLAFMSQGLMEFTQPLAKHLDFLFNSHMANVRKVMKNMLLVDPTKVDVDDILDNTEGGIIRLLSTGYGQDPAQFVKQLNVADVTSGHIASSKDIIEMWEQFTGVTRHMFGQISSGRRTAFELQGVFRQAGARMKMQADLFSAEGVAPLTEQMALMRQENMSRAQFIELVGRTAADMGVRSDEIVEGFMKVHKTHLTGVFSYPAEEGVLPDDRAAAAEILQEAFNTTAQYPFLMQAFNPVMIFRELIRQKGLHNLDDFLNNGMRAEVEIMSPDKLAELYAKKQITPLGGGRPDEGVRKERNTLTTEGFFNGAGASYSPR